MILSGCCPIEAQQLVVKLFLPPCIYSKHPTFPDRSFSGVILS